ncbi:MAG: ADP-ribosylglycohydrolase family protein [Thaumarchaeota archaeon]|jgi:poly(ADP-ribose) glycohydrolase ARH3|nr:ADP-ribosylglycohydrolase family protein [Candidatus Wolframiiraptor allenii]
MSLEQKFSGCMLSAALGDALGAGYGSGAELRYTDDAAMMIALAEHLLENYGEVDPLKLAWKFLEAYEAEPWRGYGPGPPRIFKMIRRGEGPLELDKRLYPGGSLGNGAAMRIAPIGLLYHDDVVKLMEAVRASCKPTHNHPLAIEGALLEAYSVAIAVRLDPSEDADPKDFTEQLIQLPVSEIYQLKLKLIPRLIDSGADRMSIVRSLGNMVEAHNSVPTAIYCYLAEQDPARVIRRAIGLGGDRDTIACMAAAIAGAHRGIESLPESLLSRLENSSRIRLLAQNLYQLWLEIKKSMA